MGKRRSAVFLLSVAGLCMWFAIWGCRSKNLPKSVQQLSGSLSSWGNGEPPMPKFSPLIFKKLLPKFLQGDSEPQVPRVAYQPRPPAEAKVISEAKGKALNRVQKKWLSTIGDYYKDGEQTRLLLQSDKPLYKPGETIWLRSVELFAQGNAPVHWDDVATYQLLSPRDVVVRKGTVRVKKGHSHFQFWLSNAFVGGSYTIRVTHKLLGTKVEKKIFVRAYQPPRLKKKLEFVRKGYGAGDTVKATFWVKRATGTILANHSVTLIFRLQGKEIRRWSATTDAKGKLLASFVLPKKLDTDDGMLTVLIRDSGISESISRPIPLLNKTIRVGFFPEGGDGVVGLSTRVYFAARRSLTGKPIDITGEIRDGKGSVLAKVRSFHDGMGRFSFVPKAGQKYTLHITNPVGVSQVFPLPKAKRRGLTMQVLDDFRSKHKEIRLLLHSQKRQTLLLTALQHERVVGEKSIAVEKGTQKVLLPLSKQWRGIIRLTLFAANRKPLAERLLFRNRGKGLLIKMTANRKSYQPRQTVHLKLKVQTPDGEPVVGAKFGVSVVDDATLNFADDHEPLFLAQRYLSSQLKGKIHKPNFYFRKDKPKAPRALDLVMGTHGWRTFAWKKIKRGARDAKQRLKERKKQRINLTKRLRYVSRQYYDPYARQRRAWERRLAVSLRPVIKVAKHADPETAKAKPKVRKKSRRMERAKGSLDMKTLEAEIAKQLSRKSFIGFKGSRSGNQAKDTKGPLRSPTVGDREEDKAPSGKSRVASRLEPAPKPSKPMKMRSTPPPMRRVSADPPPPPPPSISKLPTPAFAPKRRARRAKKKPVPRRVVPRRRWRRSRWRRKRWRRYGSAGMRKPSYFRFSYVRTFPTRFYREKRSEVRDDFRDTVYWNPMVVTDAFGEAKMSFGLCDSVTSFRVRAVGVGKGFLGTREKVLRSDRPFFMSVKFPMEVSAGDAMVLPLTLRNNTDKAIAVKVKSKFSKNLQLAENPLPGELKLGPSEARTYFYPVRIKAKRGYGRASFSAKSQGLSDSIQRTITIHPRGFPYMYSKAGTLKPGKEQIFTFTLPQKLVMAPKHSQGVIYPNPLGSLERSVESMIRAPYGCFEQTSSSNYPNTMALQFLRGKKYAAASLQRRAYNYLDRGYKRLVSFEVKGGGFDWFGHAPAHEGLTAYGLMQFMDMKQVYPKVSKRMVKRTVRWLHSRKDGKGGFKNARAYKNFGNAHPDIFNAYITYALAESGRRDVMQEIGGLEDKALGSKDPYFASLVLNALLKVRGLKHKVSQSLLKKILGFQRADGSFHGTKHSITRSYGRNLHIETTSLATLAMLRAKVGPKPIFRAIRWLRKQRSPYGGFGTTQATVLALKAIVQFDKRYGKEPSNGSLEVKVNEQVVSKTNFFKNARSVSFKKFISALRPGKNTLKLKLASKRAIPFGLGFRYYTFAPHSSPNTRVDLKTTLQKEKLKLGETVRLTATLTNKTKEGLPMTMARIRFPGALSYQTWQLKALKEKKMVAYYETRPREVILYLRGMKPSEKKDIHLDLVASVTGNYNSSSSSAYLYYTNEDKVWTKPLRVSVTP